MSYKTLETTLYNYREAQQSLDRVIVVSQDGQYGFTSVKSAVDYAATQSPADGNEWVVKIYPGIYNEDPFTVNPYVYVVAYSDTNSTVEIRANNSAANLCTLTGNNFVTGITFSGPTAIGTSCVYFAGSSSGAIALKSCGFYNCYCGLYTTSYNSAAPAMSYALECFINITGASSSIRDVLRVEGGYASLYGIGVAVFVPSAVLPLYPADDPIRMVVHTLDGAKAFLTSCLLSVPGNTASQALAIADAGGINGDPSSITIVSSEFTGSYSALKTLQSGCRVDALSCNFFGNTLDFNVAAAGSTITVQGGVIDAVTKYVESGGFLEVFVSDNSTSAKTLSGEYIYEYQNGSRVPLSDFFHDWSATGVSHGGDVSKNTGLTVDVSSGSGWVNDHTSESSSYVEWSSVSGLLLTASTDNYIYVDGSGVVTVSTSPVNEDSNIILAEVFTDTTDVRYIHAEKDLGRVASKSLKEYIESVIGTQYSSGLVISAGVDPDDDKFSCTSGEYWLILDKVSVATKNLTDNFYYGFGNAITDYSLTNALSLTQYDNSGVLTTMTAGYFRRDTVFVTSDGVFTVVIGSSEHALQATAEDLGPAVAPNTLNKTYLTIAGLVVQEGVGIVSVTDYRPTIVSGVASESVIVSSHSALTDLTNDDHLQYLRTDGSRVLSGPWSLGGNNLTNVGTINSVSISSHGSRHAPAGSDPVPTGLVGDIQNLGASNAAGTANSFSRSDHVHSVPSNFITNSNLSNVPTGTVKGRATLGSGSPEDLTPSQARSVLAVYSSSEVDTLVDPLLKAPEDFSPSGSYPTTYGGNPVKQADTFRISSDGTVGTVPVDAGDFLICLVDSPAQTDSNWMVVERNRSQATETSLGVVELATQVEVDARLDDLRSITPLKLANYVIDDTQHGSRGGGPLHATATTSSAGFMSDSDKLKLDGIPSGGYPQYSNQNSSTPTTTTSVTYVVLAPCSIIPGSGTYLVYFDAGFSHGTNNGEVFYAVYVAGSIVGGERLWRRGSSNADVSTPGVITGYPVTVTAGQAIEIRWRTVTGTATAGTRNLTLIKVA